MLKLSFSLFFFFISFDLDVVYEPLQFSLLQLARLRMPHGNYRGDLLPRCTWDLC